MDVSKLEKIGLTSQQAKVYVKLLELGPVSVGILIKQLDIARISCYDTLNRLISKGLVSFINVRGTRIYQATDPSRLLNIAKEKEEESKKQRKSVEEVVLDLNKLKISRTKIVNDATIYKTKEGMKSLFELMLKTKKTIYTISATGKAIQEMKYYFPQWHARRKKLHIKTYVIFNNELRNKQLIDMPLSEVRFLSKEHGSPSTVFIFGEYVITLLWSDVPIAFLIKSSEISKSYLNYFNLIWSIAKP